MSIKTIRSLLESHLAGMPECFPTAWENVPFTAPEDGLWQQAFLLTGNTQNPTLGDGHKRHVGIFQVSIHGPTGVGTSDVSDAVDTVMAHFKRGLTLRSDAQNVTVRVLNSPAVANGGLVGSYVIAHVSITYQADVYF